MVADAIVAIVIAFATYAFFRWLASAIDFRFTALSIIGLTAYFALWITNNRDLIEVVTHKVPRVLPIYIEKTVEDAVALFVWGGLLITCTFLPHWLWHICTTMPLTKR